MPKHSCFSWFFFLVLLLPEKTEAPVKQIMRKKKVSGKQQPTTMNHTQKIRNLPVQPRISPSNVGNVMPTFTWLWSNQEG